MSSGLGFNGEVSRCFYFFRDFTECLKKDSVPLKNCGELRDDYLECIHNRRVMHKLQVQSEQAAGHGNEHGGNGHGGGGH